MTKVSLLLPLVALVALGGCDDALSAAAQTDTRDMAHVRFVNAYRENSPIVVHLYREDGIEIGTGNTFSEVASCVQTAAFRASVVPAGQQRIEFKREGDDDVLTSVTHDFDAAKEYLILLYPDPAANPPAPKAVVIEEAFAGVTPVPADSFAVRIINAGSTAGTVLFSQPGTGTGFTAGPALVAGTPAAPVALTAPTFVGPQLTLARGALSDPTWLRFSNDITGTQGPRRIRFFTDGILTTTDGTTATAVAPRSNVLVGGGSFTAANNRMATVILTDRPNTGFNSAIVAPRCPKIS